MFFESNTTTGRSKKRLITLNNKVTSLKEAAGVAYCPALKATLFSGNAAAATFRVKDFAGKTILSGIAFLSADGKEASNSFYTGELVVQ